MKPDEVRSQHPEEELPPPGADSEGLRVRPGNVPENRDPRVGPPPLEESGQQGQVVILDQDARLPEPLQFAQRGLCERPVGLFVVGPVLRPEQGPGVGDVAEGPEPLVRKPVVVALLLVLREGHPLERVERILGGDLDPVPFLDDVPIGIPGTVRDPGPAAGPQDRVERRDQAAGRYDALQPETAADVHVGLPVGHHDERLPLEPLAHVLAQPVGRPLGFRRLPEPGFLLGRGPGAGELPGEPLDLPCQRVEESDIRKIRAHVLLARAQLSHP